MIKQLLLLLVIGMLSSCSNEDGKESQSINMRSNHFYNTGIAVGPVLTLLAQEGNAIGSGKWNKFYNTIEGFEYVPGKIYDLSVRVEQIINPPADSSSLKYTLIEVVSV